MFTFKFRGVYFTLKYFKIYEIREFLNHILTARELLSVKKWKHLNQKKKHRTIKLQFAKLSG